ncbi:MAG TPA: MerR family transcriptional regulator [Ktedonobacteraceae bacterium]|nr:MerR family transcriptional regulator [Ktedonobacteraceae bacterium]
MKRKPRTPAQNTGVNDASLPKYTIGVVSQLLGLPPQMLRRYEEAGLLEPARQSGKNRLYSDQDLAVLEEIAELYEQGVNAAGMRHIIQMRRQVVVLQQEVNKTRETLVRYQEELQRVDITYDESNGRP